MTAAEIINAMCSGFKIAGLAACASLATLFVVWICYLGYVAWLQAGERDEVEGAEDAPAVGSLWMTKDELFGIRLEVTHSNGKLVAYRIYSPSHPKQPAVVQDASDFLRNHIPAL